MYGVNVVCACSNSVFGISMWDRLTCFALSVCCVGLGIRKSFNYKQEFMKADLGLSGVMV